MSLDFHYNKRVCDEVSIMPSKRVRNKVAGYATRLMKRIQQGPVRGISLKLQEEERERRMEFVPTESEFKLDYIKLDDDTRRMLEDLGLGRLVNERK